jgi:hypothetical protein
VFKNPLNDSKYKYILHPSQVSHSHIFKGLLMVSEHVQELPVVVDKSLYVVVVEKKRHLRSRFSPRGPDSTQEHFAIFKCFHFSIIPKGVTYILGVTTRLVVNSGKLNEMCVVHAFLRP